MRIRAALFCSLGLAFRENRREACPRAEENMVAARREEMTAKFVILSGSASQKLAMATAQRLGAEIGQCSVQRFPDTEVNVQLNEPVHKRRVFIVQSSCPPVDQHITEVLAIAGACRRAAASSVTWIAPYFGYARAISDGAGELQ